MIVPESYDHWNRGDHIGILDFRQSWVISLYLSIETCVAIMTEESPSDMEIDTHVDTRHGAAQFTISTQVAIQIKISHEESR